MSEEAVASAPEQARQRDHNLHQRHYYETVERERIAIVDTPYVRAHTDRVIKAGDLRPGQRILEVGAGPGKFTLQLADRGLDVVANDLSPRLLDQLTEASNGSIPVLACDVLDLADETDETFDRIVGFFMLHHLIDFERVFAALARVAKPGARFAFLEPVGTNPLYAAQIALTPHMSFKGERSIFAMRADVILPAMRAAGLVDARAERQGYLPPQLRNRAWGGAAEAWLERLPVPFPRAFHLFTARMPD